MITLEQIDSKIEHLRSLLANNDPRASGRDDSALQYEIAIYTLARERLTAGTFQQGIEAAADVAYLSCLRTGCKTYLTGGLKLKRGPYDMDYAREAKEAIRNLKPEVGNG